MNDRDQAIRDLADALARLAQADQTGQDPTVRMTLGPAGVFTAADLYRSIDLTPKAAQSLADAVDSMNAYLASEPTTGTDHPDAQEWSAAAVAQNNPDLYADITDVFMLLDPQDLTDSALQDPQTDRMSVVHALDDVLGEIPFPFVEEDAPLPTEQWQIDALTDEAESFLKDGDA